MHFIGGGLLLLFCVAFASAGGVCDEDALSHCVGIHMDDSTFSCALFQTFASCAAAAQCETHATAENLRALAAKRMCNPSQPLMNTYDGDLFVAVPEGKRIAFVVGYEETTLDDVREEAQRAANEALETATARAIDLRNEANTYTNQVRTSLRDDLKDYADGVGTAAENFTVGIVDSLRAHVGGVVSNVTQLQGDAGQLREDLDAHKEATELRLNATTSDLSTVGGQIADLQTNDVSAYQCARIRQIFNPGPRGCETLDPTDVNPLQFTGPVCTAPNTIRHIPGGRLVFCDGSNVAHWYHPVVAGTHGDVPAPDCAAAVAPTGRDGFYFIGPSAERRYCRGDQALTYWPSFEQIGGAPIAYWPFDGNTKDVINGYDGTIDGDAVTYTEGRVGQSAVFGGATRVAIPLDDYHFQGAFTVSAWVYIDTLTGDNPILSHGQGSTNSYLHYIVRGLRAMLAFFSNDLETRNIFVAQRWYHIVWVVTSALRRSVYINGMLVGDDVSASPYVGVGQTFLAGFGTGRLRGRLDEVMIFSRALDRAAVWQLYNMPPTNAANCAAVEISRFPPALYSALTSEQAPGGGPVFCLQGAQFPRPLPFVLPVSIMGRAPVFHYTMEAGISDAMMYADPVITGLTYATARDGRLGRAVQWPNSNDLLVRLPFLARTFFTGSWTFVLWVRVSSFPASGQQMPLLCEGVGGVGANGQALHLTIWSDRRLRFDYFGDDLDSPNDQLLQANEWYHLAFVKDGDTRRIFRNGVSIAQKGTGSYNGRPENSEAARLGGCAFLDTPFNGAMDEVSLYDRALGAQELNYLRVLATKV